MTNRADTVIIKSTSLGLVVDTILSSHDSLHITAGYHTSISIPDNTIKIVLPEKSNLEIFSTWAIIIGGLAGLFGAIAAFWQLFKKNKVKERQIGELIQQTKEIKEQTRINQQRLKLQVMPRLISEGHRFENGYISLFLSNKGEKCFIDQCELIYKGEKSLIPVQVDWSEIPKDNTIPIDIPFEKEHDKTFYATISIRYHDIEKFDHVTTFDLKIETACFIDPNEL